MLFLKSRGITRKKADSEIMKGQEINEATQTVMQLAFAISGNQHGRAYFKENYNAFVFERESVLKYFYGPNIPELPKGAAEVMVVITGAHDITEEDPDGTKFVAGERTAIICGMIEKKDENGVAIEVSGETVLTVVNPAFVLGNLTTPSSDTPVADQYPPRRILQRLPKFDGGDFEVVLKPI